MPVYLDRKTNRLFIQFQLKGQTYKERLPAKTKKSTAEQIEIKWKNDLLFESHGIPTKRTEITFEAFLRDYFGPYAEAHYSAANFERAVGITKAALPFFKGKTMRSIKAADVDRFQSARKALPTPHKTPRKPATVLRELSILSKIFSLAVKNDLIDSNPCSKIEKPKFDNVMDLVLRYEDEEKFFANMFSKWAKDICMMALYSGLRQNDIMNLTRFECDLEQGWIRLTQGKTQRRIDVRINQVMHPILERQIRRHPTGPLFPSPADGSVNGSVRHAMKRACARAKIPALTIRDLRRTFAFRLQDNGEDALTIAGSLGHGDLRSVHRYARSLKARQEASDLLASNAPNLPSRENVKLEIVEKKRNRG